MRQDVLTEVQTPIEVATRYALLDGGIHHKHGVVDVDKLKPPLLRIDEQRGCNQEDKPRPGQGGVTYLALSAPASLVNR